VVSILNNRNVYIVVLSLILPIMRDISESDLVDIKKKIKEREERIKRFKEYKELHKELYPSFFGTLKKMIFGDKF